MLLLLAAALAWAEMPLPGYDAVLADRVYREVDARIGESCTWSQVDLAFACGEGIEEAIARAEAFQDAVLSDPGLEYLIGLAWKYKGDDARAARHYRAALALDAATVEAWYDLGEIYLVQGDFDSAEEAFVHVAELRTEGEFASLGPRRLAEVAAHQHDAEAFERHIHEALRRGFSFRDIQGLPNWKAYYADPALHDSIEKLVSVYGEPSTLDSLR